MRIELPDPHINQQKILDSNARFRVVMAGRRFGKSELSQIEIIVNALQGKQVFYVTPTYNLARVFFDQLAKAVPFEANKFEADILSLVKDADAATAQLKTIQDNLTKQIASIQKLATDAEKNYDAQDKIWDKAKIAAENLGLKKEDIKGWKEFENSRLTIRKAFDAANKFRK